MGKIIKNTICSRCIMDTTVPKIQFDKNGSCNFCKVHDFLEKDYPNNKNGKKILNEIIKKIKKENYGQKYDCVVGVSGGTDSSYTLYLAKKYGLRPLAVHFDNGWNSEIAVENIKKICQKLNVDLYTYVVNWEEFKNLQISFLKASVPDAEIPTDIGIHATLIKVANKEKIKHVLNGHSFRTEGMAPKEWTYMDGQYIKSVHKQFGKIPLKTFPNFTIIDFLYYNIIKGIKIIPFLNYFNYEKIKVRKLLSNKFSWKYYGGHHHENIYTLFIQSFLLPKKFNIDKRKTELSAMIRANQTTRSQALKIINTQKYKYKEDIVKYTINKLCLSKKAYNKIISKKNKSFHDYFTYYNILIFLKFPIQIAYKMNLIPKLLYYKFLCS